MYKYIASKLYIYYSVLKIRGCIKKLIIKLTNGIKRISSNSQNMFVSFISFLYNPFILVL